MAIAFPGPKCGRMSEVQRWTTEIPVELDPVGRVELDGLHLAALRQRGHHLQAVPQDHPVRPVRVTLVELRPRLRRGQPVEASKHVDLHIRVPRPAARLLALPLQVVDQHLGVHLLLYIERRRRDGKRLLGLDVVCRILAPCGSRSRLRRSCDRRQAPAGAAP
jgi:hypothetical protein